MSIDHSAESQTVSVIIPMLNEQDRVNRAINSALEAGAAEVIVVDGGSSDDSIAVATKSGAHRVISSTAGRANQQNTGAEKANGQVLLFLHADCLLPVTAIQSICRCLSDSKISHGCFRQAIDADGKRFRWIERGNAWRVKWLKWLYGDQAIFVRRSAFEAAGRFPDVRFMEDLLISKSLTRQGRCCLLDDRITVSARRWQTHGLIRQTLRNWMLITLAKSGVSPNRLAKFYPNVR